MRKWLRDNLCLIGHACVPTSNNHRYRYISISIPIVNSWNAIDRRPCIMEIGSTRPTPFPSAPPHHRRCEESSGHHPSSSLYLPTISTQYIRSPYILSCFQSSFSSLTPKRSDRLSRRLFIFHSSRQTAHHRLSPAWPNEPLPQTMLS